MNVSSKTIRQSLTVFDNKSFLRRNIVSKSALLKDTGYSLHSFEEISRLVFLARNEMARIARVPIHELRYIHSGSNGRNDCDNYAEIGSYIVKLLHDAECRENGRNDEFEYAIFPIARADMNHTQAIALSDKNQWYLVEFITGEITIIDETNKPLIMMVM